MGAITDALGFSPEKAARPSTGGMPDLSREWPGRQVSVAIEDPEVKLLLQSWLVRMARAGGKGLSRTLTQLMRPPHAALIKRVGVQLAPILEGLLLRHFEAVAEAERAAANKPASATAAWTVAMARRRTTTRPLSRRRRRSPTCTAASSCFSGRARRR